MELSQHNLSSKKKKRERNELQTKVSPEKIHTDTHDTAILADFKFNNLTINWYFSLSENQITRRTAHKGQVSRYTKAQKSCMQFGQSPTPTPPKKQKKGGKEKKGYWIS